MIVFGSLIVVILVTLIFYLRNPKEYKWWEFFIPLGVTIIAILISKILVERSAVTFTEYWGSSVVYVVEEEPWNEWISQTCSRQVPCGTDANGNTTYCTEYYDCSYQDDHPPKWWLETNIGENINISEKWHDKLVKQFKTDKKVVKTRRNYASNDRAVGSKGTKFAGTRVGRTSNIYQTKWNNEDETRQAVSSKHRYENRIKASDLSVFNISVVTDEEADSLGLYKYPLIKDELNYPTILGNVDKSIQEKFQKINGKYGPTNQLRLWILLFDKKPSMYGQYQENYWVKGNKNELVICIGTDGNEIKWSHAFSWALSSTLTAEVKSKVLDLYEYTIITKEGQKLPVAIPVTKEFDKVLSTLGLDSVYIGKLKDAKVLPLNFLNTNNIQEVKKSKTPVLSETTWQVYYDYLNKNLNKFERRQFEEFSYIKVNPSTGAIIFIYVLALLISIGVNYWASNNEISE